MNAFESLRHDDRPERPDRSFAARLRARIEAELAPTVPLPDRSSTMPATSPDTPAPDTTRHAPPTLVPYLAVAGAAQAIDWYGAVFGAVERIRYRGDDGRIGHAELEIGGAVIYLSDEYPDVDAVAPTASVGSGVSLHLHVPDVDAVWAAALAAGADGRRPPADQPYGDRSCTFVDPFGHRWMVQTHIADPTIAEIEARMEGFTITTTDEPDGA